MGNEETHAITATVAGRVHGVGFRYSTQRAAADCGVTGWVCNQPDGTVSALVQGPPAAVRRMITFLEQGPPAARVSSCTISECVPDPQLAGFRVLY